MSLEVYKCSSNLFNDALTKKISQSGSFQFRLPANMSGKCGITFDKIFKDTPFVSVTVSFDNDNVLEGRWALSKISAKAFETHLCNSDIVNELTGTVYWTATN